MSTRKFGNSVRSCAFGALAIAAVMAPGAGFAADAGATSPELDVLGTFVVPYEGLTTDVWAYGNYAYIGSFSSPKCSLDITGVRVIDISNPTEPAQVAFIPAKPATRNNDVKVGHIDTPVFSGEILVATNEGCADHHPRLNANENSINDRRPGQGGFSIWDVTNPAKPRALAQHVLGGSNGIHNTFIWQQGENAYLIAVDDVDTRDTIVVDITDPENPVEITRTGPQDWPGLGSADVQGAEVFLHDVWVQENGGKIIAYLSYWDAGLVLLDVTDPANPVFMGDSVYPDPDLSGLPPEGNGHVAVPNADASLVIFGDEDTSKFSSFMHYTVGADALGPTKIGSASFGPQPAIDTFPEPGNVVSVANSLGCNAGDFDPAPGGAADVVLIERGVCFFTIKAANAQAAGYDAYIVFNSVAGGEGVQGMGGTDSSIDIPGLFVARSLGLTMAAEVGAGGTVTITEVSGTEDGEGFMRVIDVTNPANMVQVGSFATAGTLPPLNAQLTGTRDAHNVVVRGDRAYWAWYHEGIRVVDFSDCQAGDGFEGCSPTETAHFGGGDVGEPVIADFWGVYLHDLPDGQTVILGSDRGEQGNGAGGLYIFANP